VVKLVKAGFRVRVWGPYWQHRTEDSALARQYVQGGYIEGADFVRAVKCSQISINRTDDTNFPAANMRFFELLACGMAGLNSPTPEMEELFPDNELTFYYRDSDHLVDRVRALLKDEAFRTRVARAGHDVALKHHTYDHRARELLLGLKLSNPAA
jgi:spore maturation protein CgeB